MILNREQFMDTIGGYVGDDNSPEALQFIENMTDTFNDLENRTINTDDYVPKAELQRVNDEWATKYKERFLQGTPTPDPTLKKDEEEQDKNKPLLFDNLFTEG